MHRRVLHFILEVGVIIENSRKAVCFKIFAEQLTRQVDKGFVRNGNILLNKLSGILRFMYVCIYVIPDIGIRNSFFHNLRFHVLQSSIIR